MLMCAKPSVQDLVNEATANVQQRSARAVVNEECLLGGPLVQSVCAHSESQTQSIINVAQVAATAAHTKELSAECMAAAPCAGSWRMGIQNVSDIALPQARAGVLEGVLVQGVPVERLAMRAASTRLGIPLCSGPLHNSSAWPVGCKIASSTTVVVAGGSGLQHLAHARWCMGKLRTVGGRQA